MTRRALLMLLPAALAGADPGQEVFDLFTSMASALTQQNDSAFLAAFDPAMPGYQDLAGEIKTLMWQSVVESSLEFESNEGDARARTVQVIWTLRIQHARDTARAVHREQRVTAKVEKKGKNWRVVSFTPIKLFAPE